MFSNVKNFDQQGNIGLIEAIRYFIMNNYTVSIPLNDAQPYDLIVDLDGKLSRVSVKTSGCVVFRKNNPKHSQYKINVGTNYISNGKYIKAGFNCKSCDLVFILLSDGRAYLFPSSVLNNKKCFEINGSFVGKDKYSSYRVNTGLMV